MAIDKSGTFWRGENDDDLATYLRAFEAGGHPVDHVRHLTCPECGSLTFRVLVDDDESCAVTECLSCHTQTPVADSAEQLDDAEPEECACPCGGETFTAALGYAMTEDNEVRWISLGLRCLTDGTLGVYTDWKIDYAPTAHLLPPG